MVQTEIDLSTIIPSMKKLEGMVFGVSSDQFEPVTVNAA
jgi:hypothetical protein